MLSNPAGQPGPAPAAHAVRRHDHQTRNTLRALLCPQDTASHADGTHGSADPCACSRPDLRASPPETWKHTPMWEAMVKVGLDRSAWWAAQRGGPPAEQRNGQDTHLLQRFLHTVQEKPQEASLPVSIHILSTSSTTSWPRMVLRPSALNDGRGWGHTHIWRKFEIGEGAENQNPE